MFDFPAVLSIHTNRHISILTQAITTTIYIGVFNIPHPVRTSRRCKHLEFNAWITTKRCWDCMHVLVCANTNCWLDVGKRVGKENSGDNQSLCANWVGWIGSHLVGSVSVKKYAAIRNVRDPRGIEHHEQSTVCYFSHNGCWKCLWWLTWTVISFPGIIQVHRKYTMKDFV